jgi:hypothetical protein
MSRTYLSATEIKCVEYVPNFITSISYEQLLQEVQPFFYSDSQSSIVMYGKRINVPRKQCSFADEGKNL